MCTKQTYFLVPLLIPSTKQPRSVTDVYLQLLLDELKGLWIDGLEIYDASRNENFHMHVALM